MVSDQVALKGDASGPAAAPPPSPWLVGEAPDAARYQQPAGDYDDSQDAGRDPSELAGPGTATAAPMTAESGDYDVSGQERAANAPRKERSPSRPARLPWRQHRSLEKALDAPSRRA